MYRNVIRLSLAFTAVLTLSAQAQNTITLEDVWSFKFWGSAPEAYQSMPDGEHYTMIKSGNNNRYVSQFEFSSGDSLGALFSMNDISEAAGEPVPFSQYSFNKDQTKVLVAANVESIYRHSTKGNFYVYNLESKAIVKVGEGKIRYATFSPDGMKVGYVQGNDLYMLNLEDQAVTQITEDGEFNAIINGATDWVYEEEFAFDKAFWWSPNSQYIAFLRFDESEVPEFSMDVYGNELYPTQDVFKYPKAGEKNAVVTAHIYDAAAGTTTQVLEDLDYEYIPRIMWNPEDEAIIFTMNRHQNELALWEIDCEDDYEVELFLTDSDEAYVEISDNFRFTEDGDLVFTSERDGYNHLYMVDDDGENIQQITDGDWDVLELYGVDSKYAYFQAAAVHPSQREVYRIRLNGRGMKSLSTGEGSASAQFNTDMSYYMLSFQSVDRPAMYTMHEADGTQMRVLEDNQALIDRMEDYHYVPKEFFDFTTSEDIELNGWMIKPHDFDPTKEYPLLMFVYGGPGSQQVVNNWDALNGMYYQYLASLGYIVACVDNRGTGARGSEFKKITYQQLGHYETIDQIEAAKYFGSLEYIDAARIGIWGWSYGGYMSSNCLAQGADVFKAAIAVAPVTNWRFYDTIYTERYMRTPQENASGYDDNSPINHASKIRGSYLLVHGSADDNVHVQNTMRMVETLVQANVQFDLFIYPDKNHSIFGGMTRYHLYTKMTRFLQENL
ncbi:S9 family peptidase [Phaeocystidibacter luteus]|uniref:S9 family peptidase n=1 Tax=Phaeocystidibacter luteus TaxID=911197 RepID=A0A6N6RKF2_9FLAO|nr:S9 family peptidase [Phaeocystidibacter luteus]KAB2805473.1 S9 family peptidase [Phaeocystidibacter luteus]